MYDGRHLKTCDFRTEKHERNAATCKHELSGEFRHRANQQQIESDGAAPCQFGGELPNQELRRHLDHVLVHQFTKNPSTKSESERIGETDNERCENGRAVPSPRGAEQAPSMMRFPPWSEYMRANSNESRMLVERTSFCPARPGLCCSGG